MFLSTTEEESAMDETLCLQSLEPMEIKQEAQSKRTASEAGFDGSDGKSTRKRASKACQSCRARKVRCSVSDHGIPCYNCKLDGLQCVIPERKKPVRTAKRQKSLGAAISEAALKMDSPPSEGAHSPTDSAMDTEFALMNDWDVRAVGINSPPTSQSSPSASENSNHHNFSETINTQPYDDIYCKEEDHIELPPCDEELARWFGVMPPRVVDKMLDYLTSLSHFGKPDHNTISRSRRTKQRTGDKVRFIPPKSHNRWRSIAPQVQDRLQCRIPQQTPTPSFAQQNAEPLSPQSQQGRMSPLSAPEQQQQQQINSNILEQLRSSYGMAKDTLDTLENTIRRVNSQMSNTQDAHAHNARHSADKKAHYNNPNPAPNTKAPATSDLPVNQNSYTKSMRTLQHIEKLLSCSSPTSATSNETGYGAITQASKPRMDPLDGLNMAEVVPGTTGGKEDDFQAAFESLIDFGAGDNTYQSLDFGVA